MPRYKVTAVEIFTPIPVDHGSNQIPISNEIEVYSQTLNDLNLAVLIKALNPTTRKRRAKKEAA